MKANGTFAAQQTFAAGNDPQSITVGDFNGDGTTDLAVANIDSDDVSVLLGVGNGTFTNQQVFGTGRLPVAITTGDFNGDGLTDLTTANRAPGGVSVLLGIGDGTFAEELGFAICRSDSVSTGDFNGDGMTDLATTNRFNNEISVLLNQCDTGSGTIVPGSFEAFRGVQFRLAAHWRMPSIPMIRVCVSIRDSLSIQPKHPCG